MIEIPAAVTADVTDEIEYDCWSCHWRPTGEAFCGTCIRKILETMQAEKEIRER